MSMGEGKSAFREGGLQNLLDKQQKFGKGEEGACLWDIPIQTCMASSTPQWLRNAFQPKPFCDILIF